MAKNTTPTAKPYNTFPTSRLTAIEESNGWRMCTGGCGCGFERRKVPHAHQWPVTQGSKP